jgi:GrpB-like predicted nucleotidyltransferase (UPF0157 family)
MLGSNRKGVELVSHQKAWKTFFEREAGAIRRALGDLILGVEHIGSTSIPEIEAKPIIDIIVGIKSLSLIENCILPLEKIGYEYRGEHGVKNRPFFRKGTFAASTHHLSVVEYGGEIWRLIPTAKPVLSKKFCAWQIRFELRFCA